MTAQFPECPSGPRNARYWFAGCNLDRLTSRPLGDIGIAVRSLAVSGISGSKKKVPSYTQLG